MAPFIVPTITPAEQAKKMQDRVINMIAGKLTDKQKRICDSRGRARGDLRWNVNATVFTDGRGKAIEMVRDAFLAEKIDLAKAEVLLHDIFGRKLRGNWQELLEPRKRRSRNRKPRSVTERPVSIVPPSSQAAVEAHVVTHEQQDELQAAWAEFKNGQLIRHGIDPEPEPVDEYEELAWSEAGWGSDLDVNFWGGEDDDREWASLGMHVVTARAGVAGFTS